MKFYEANKVIPLGKVNPTYKILTAKLFSIEIYYLFEKH